MSEPHPDQPPGVILLPAPTAAPMILALGVTLLSAGLVTHWSVSVVGLVLTIAGGIAWWRQVLPAEQLEAIPLRAPAARVRPAAPVAVAVDRRLGTEGEHRLRLPTEVQPLSAGVRGGLVGGVAMAAVALAYGILVQRSPWYPINLLAAVAMPAMSQADLAALRAFNGPALALGIVAHGVISVLVGLLYAAILPTLPRRSVIWGGLVAPLLWTGLLWAVLGVINPVLNARVDWPWFILSQVAFGLAAGVVVARAHPVPTAQSRSLERPSGERRP